MRSCDGFDEPVAEVVDLVDALVFVHPRLLCRPEFDSQSSRAPKSSRGLRPVQHKLLSKEESV